MYMYFRQLIILHQRQKIYFYMTVLKNLLKIYFLIPWNECLCIQASLEPVNLYNIIQVTLHQVCNPHDNLVSQHTKCGRSYQYMYMYLHVGINVMNQMNAFWPTSNWMKKKSIFMIHLLPQYWYDKIKMADLKFEKKLSVGVNLYLGFEQQNLHTLPLFSQLLLYLKKRDHWSHRTLFLQRSWMSK